MTGHPSKPPYEYCFTAYGVRVRLSSGRRALITRAADVVTRTLLGNLEIVPGDGGFDHTFTFGWNRTEGYTLDQNGSRITSIRWAKGVFKYFDSLVRVSIAEFSPDLVFLHAGVVAWRGKAIIIPGDSFTGKSTLVTELIKIGATYYSDEFAILDREGLVHPFARPINRRTDDGRFKPYTLAVDDITGRVGTEGIEVGGIVITEFKPGAKWKPKRLAPGEGILAVIPHTIPVRKNTDLSLSVLNKIASRALIIKTKRPEAALIAHKLLDFIDNPSL